MQNCQQGSAECPPGQGTRTETREPTPEIDLPLTGIDAWLFIGLAVAIIFMGLAIATYKPRRHYRPTMSRERQEEIWERQGLKREPDDSQLL